MIKEVIGNATLYCGDSNEILGILDAVDSCAKKCTKGYVLECRV